MCRLPRHTWSWGFVRFRQTRVVLSTRHRLSGSSWPPNNRTTQHLQSIFAVDAQSNMQLCFHHHEEEKCTFVVLWRVGEAGLLSSLQRLSTTEDPLGRLSLNCLRPTIVDPYNMNTKCLRTRKQAQQHQQQYNLERLCFYKRGASTPLWEVESRFLLSRRSNPIEAIPPYVVRTPYLHGHRLRRKHLLLNPDTNAGKEKKQKRNTFF